MYKRILDAMRISVGRSPDTTSPFCIQKKVWPIGNMLHDESKEKHLMSWIIYTVYVVWYLYFLHGTSRIYLNGSSLGCKCYKDDDKFRSTGNYCWACDKTGTSKQKHCLLFYWCRGLSGGPYLLHYCKLLRWNTTIKSLETITSNFPIPAWFWEVRAEALGRKFQGPLS